MSTTVLRATGALTLAAGGGIVLAWGPDSGINGVTLVGVIVGLIGLWLATEPDDRPL